MEPELCRLQDAVGRVEACPGGRCPFWDEEACIFHAVGPDVFARPDIAQHLLELRHSLEHARAENAPETRRLFYLLDRPSPPTERV